MIKILHVKLFFCINIAARHNIFWFSCPTDIVVGGGRVRGRRVKHISGYNPPGDRLEPATGYCSPATRTGHFPRWCHCGEWWPGATCHRRFWLMHNTFVCRNNQRGYNFVILFGCTIFPCRIAGGRCVWSGHNHRLSTLPLRPVADLHLLASADHKHWPGQRGSAVITGCRYLISTLRPVCSC